MTLDENSLFPSAEVSIHSEGSIHASPNWPFWSFKPTCKASDQQLLFSFLPQLPSSFVMLSSLIRRLLRRNVLRNQLITRIHKVKPDWDCSMMSILVYSGYYNIENIVANKRKLNGLQKCGGLRWYMLTVVQQQHGRGIKINIFLHFFCLFL